MEFPGAPEDPETISFIDPVWLQQWGLGPENALDYFALSPFYDKKCNNEQCRMQGVDPREGVKNLTGLEFMLEDLPEERQFLAPGQPPPVGPQPRRLFVVKRQMRRNPSSVEVQAIYYIMEGNIYQAPTVQKLIKSRLDKFIHHLNNAFVELSKLSELDDSAGGYDWAWQKEAKAFMETAALESVAAAGGGVASEEDKNITSGLKLSMDKILMGLVEKYIDGDADAGMKGVKRKAALPAVATDAAGKAAVAQGEVASKQAATVEADTGGASGTGNAAPVNAPRKPPR